MIEFYHNFSKTSYTSKVDQLCRDMERLFSIEGISISPDTNIEFLPSVYRRNLKHEIWIRINQLYYTLNDNIHIASTTLKKFAVKSSSPVRKKYHFIDTFAGCGGLSLGLSNAGFSPLFVNEIEPRFLESYYFNHTLPPENYFCGDIKDFVESEQVNNLEHSNIDLIVGGPPCQGFSMANRQRLIDDPRNVLYKQFLNLLSKLRPKFFVMENVKGMMNKSDEILENFRATLGDQYKFEMRLLNAKNFGVPQNRERVIVIGTRLANVSPTSIFDNLDQHSPSRHVLKDALEGLPQLKPKRIKNQRGVENSEIGFKFLPFKSNGSHFSHYLNDNREINYLSNHTNRYNNDRDIEIFGRMPQGANSLHSSIADIMPYSDRNHIFKDKYFKLDENLVSKTITSHMKLDCNMYIHPTQPRGLSPREAARIQTFPDDYIFMGANNTWYAQIGNAVPVKLAQIIGEQLMNHLNGN